MGKKRKRQRPLPDLRPKRPGRYQFGHNCDDPYPHLRPADRISHVISPRELMADYDASAENHGKTHLDDQMGYFYFFLGHSGRLLEEPEFKDASVEIAA